MAEITTAADLGNFVQRQAEDEGLWFIAETSAEAYLQQELRRLHWFVESYLKQLECEVKSEQEEAS